MWVCRTRHPVWPSSGFSAWPGAPVGPRSRVDRVTVTERPSDQPLAPADEADLQEQARPVSEEEEQLARRPERVPLEANEADVLEQSIEEPLDDDEI